MQVFEGLAHLDRATARAGTSARALRKLGRELGSSGGHFVPFLPVYLGLNAWSVILAVSGSFLSVVGRYVVFCDWQIYV